VEEDKDEDDGKEPQTIGQGEMVTHRLTMLIPWYTMSQPCYLGKARRCASIHHGHNLGHLPHGHKPGSGPHDHKLR